MNLSVRLLLTCLIACTVISCKSSSDGFMYQKRMYMKTLNSLRPLKKAYLLPEMVLLELGTVTIPESEGGDGHFSSMVGNYAISAREITVAQYCRFLNSLDSKPSELQDWITLGVQLQQSGDEYTLIYPEKDQEPITSISWNGARAYTQWLSEVLNTHRMLNDQFPMPNYRLPLEIEWFFAAKQAETNKQLLGFANTTAEWCLDSYHSSLQHTEIDRTQAKGRGMVPPKAEKTVRAGLTLSDSTEQASRYQLLPNKKKPSVGFRVAMFFISRETGE